MCKKNINIKTSNRFQSALDYRQCMGLISLVRYLLLISTFNRSGIAMSTDKGRNGRKIHVAHPPCKPSFALMKKLINFRLANQELLLSSDVELNPGPGPSRGQGGQGVGSTHNEVPSD